jgi:hypothetical protein
MRKSLTKSQDDADLILGIELCEWICCMYRRLHLDKNAFSGYNLCTNSFLISSPGIAHETSYRQHLQSNPIMQAPACRKVDRGYDIIISIRSTYEWG